MWHLSTVLVQPPLTPEVCGGGVRDRLLPTIVISARLVEVDCHETFGPPKMVPTPELIFHHVIPCFSGQQSGGLATAKADRLAVDHLRKKCHRAEESTEERAARFVRGPASVNWNA